MGGGGWQRASRWSRWKPRSYRQAWMYSVLGVGVPGFVIWAVLGPPHLYWLARGLVYGVSVTMMSGLGQSYRLRKRKRDQADLEAFRAAEAWRPSAG